VIFFNCNANKIENKQDKTRGEKMITKHEQLVIDIVKMRKKLYADSPFNLATKEDDAYRDGVDATLVLIEQSN
jgi:hypothetical protein